MSTTPYSSIKKYINLFMTTHSEYHKTPKNKEKIFHCDSSGIIKKLNFFLTIIKVNWRETHTLKGLTSLLRWCDVFLEFCYLFDYYYYFFLSGVLKKSLPFNFHSPPYFVFSLNVITSSLFSTLERALIILRFFCEMK